LRIYVEFKRITFINPQVIAHTEEMVKEAAPGDPGSKPKILYNRLFPGLMLSWQYDLHLVFQF